MITDEQCGAGMAAIAICESLLLALRDRQVLDDAEIRGLLEDAVKAQIEAASETDDASAYYLAVAMIERIMKGRNAVRG